MPEEQDREIRALIGRVKQNDDRALNGLVEKYGILLKSAVNSALTNPLFSPSDRDDLYQEALLALYRAAQTYDLGQEGVTFGLYAKICIKNRMRTVIRKYKRRKARSQSPAVRRTAPGPAPEAQNEYDAALLQRAMTLLSERERSVLALRSLGMRYAEISRTLGCSVKSVDNALKRARSKIRTYAREHRQ